MSDFKPDTVDTVEIREGTTQIISFCKRPACGVHGADWVDEEILQKLADGRFEMMTMFSFQPVEDWVRIRERFPHMRFVLRSWANWGELPDPVEHGRAIGEYLIRLHRAGVAPEAVHLLNEPNLELGGGDDWIRKINDWFPTAYHTIKWYHEVAHIPICFPPIAPGETWWPWIDRSRACLDLSDALCLHVYFQGESYLRHVYEGGQALWWSENFPTKRLYIPECGGSYGMSREDRCRLYPLFIRQMNEIPNLEGYAFFILDSRDDEWIRNGFTFSAEMLAAVSNR